MGPSTPRLEDPTACTAGLLENRHSGMHCASLSAARDHSNVQCNGHEPHQEQVERYQQQQQQHGHQCCCTIYPGRATHALHATAAGDVAAYLSESQPIHKCARASLSGMPGLAIGSMHSWSVCLTRGIQGTDQKSLLQGWQTTQPIGRRS